jgi:hypothetical protein
MKRGCYEMMLEGIRASTFAAIVSFYHREAQACLAFMVIDNYGLDHRKLPRHGQSDRQIASFFNSILSSLSWSSTL